MGIFNRNKQVNEEVIPVDENLVGTEKQILQEAVAQNAKIAGIDSYHFIRGLRHIDMSDYNVDMMYDKMIDDSIISSAINMWIEDSLQVDPQHNEIFWVEVNSTDDDVEKQLAKGLQKELNGFLHEDLNMNANLPNILRRILIYGSVAGRLDFIDRLEDKKLKVVDANKNAFKGLPESFESVVNKNAELLESANVENTHRFNNWNLLTESPTSSTSKYYKKIEEHFKKGTEGLAKLNESEGESKKERVVKLNEEYLSKVKPSLKGRWYFEMIGSGSNIYQLESRGKAIAYLDKTKPDYVIDADEIVYFSNKTGKHYIDFQFGDLTQDASKRTYFKLSKGEGFIEDARVAWQVLSALEDILLLTRMTRSALYRIFSVEVGSKGNAEVKRILDNLKSRMKMDETINVKEKVYNSELRQIPLGDSIFIPTRKGVGVIDVKTVGGDINLRDAIDLDYFKDKLFAALRIPKAFFGFGDDTAGMMNNSLAKMDTRYARTIKRIQNILSVGLKDLCLMYLRKTRSDKILDELPDFRIVFTSINTAEDNDRVEVKKTKMDTLTNMIDVLGKMGINLAEGNYKTTRDNLIKEWFGADVLESVIKDEKGLPRIPQLDDKNNAIQSTGGTGPADGSLNDLNAPTNAPAGNTNDTNAGGNEEGEPSGGDDMTPHGASETPPDLMPPA